jgi:hypothetical protein
MVIWSKDGEDKDKIQNLTEKSVGNLSDENSFIHSIPNEDPYKEYFKEKFPLTNDDTLRDDYAKEHFIAGDLDDRIHAFENDELDIYVAQLQSRSTNISIQIGELERQYKEMFYQYSERQALLQNVINQLYGSVSELEMSKINSVWGSEQSNADIEEKINKANQELNQAVIQRDTEVQLMDGNLEANVIERQELENEFNQIMAIIVNINSGRKS